MTDHEILEAALGGLIMQRDRLNEQIARVQALLGGKAATPISGKRPVSAAARKRMAEAQTRRWARYRKEKAA